MASVLDRIFADKRLELEQRKRAAGLDEIREGLSGNLCRCTGYEHIVRAVRELAPSRLLRAELSRGADKANEAILGGPAPGDPTPGFGSCDFFAQDGATRDHGFHGRFVGLPEKHVADTLDFHYLESGALYRLVALQALYLLESDPAVDLQAPDRDGEPSGQLP